MKGYEKVEEIINQAHQGTTNPVIALIARNAQSMRADGCQMTVASGATPHEAVSAASAKAGRMKDWVVVVSQLDADGNRITPAIMDQQTMSTLRKSGMNMVCYVQADGDWEYYTPIT